jgi:hypothetical protein
MVNGAAGRALVAFAYGVFPVCAVIASVVDCLQDKQCSRDVHWPTGEVKTDLRLSHPIRRRRFKRSNNVEQFTAGLR